MTTDPIRRDAYRASLWRELVHGIAAPNDPARADVRWCPIAGTWVLEPWQHDGLGWYSMHPDVPLRCYHQGKLARVTA